MNSKEKEIQAVYEKYATQGLKDCKNMIVEEEKIYIDKMEPKIKNNKKI